MDRASETETSEEARRYVRHWQQTGRELERIRARELRNLTDSDALEAADQLLSLAAELPLPEHRQRWSGLVELRSLFDRAVRESDP